MRTIKALACAAALAAGLATAVAQNVYSLNVVGYYNVTIPDGKIVMLANQLNTTNNHLDYVIPTATSFTVLFKYNNGWSGTTFYGPDLGGDGWDNKAFTLAPGEAAMVVDPGGTGGQTLTFVGEVLQGNLVNDLPLDTTSYRSSMVPQQGTPKDFNVPGESFDILWTYNNGWSGTTYYGADLGGNGWDFDGSGNGPTLAVGASFGYTKGTGNTISAWTRNFTVQ